MTRPDAPTPRTDAAWDEEWRMKAAEPNSDPAHGMCDFAMQLEMELALAQTEIKGHMRVVDELTARLEEADTALRIRATECLMQSQRAEQAQARIAELEKDAARYRWLRDIGDDSWTPLAKRITAWANDGVPISLHEIEAHIDAALKDRA